MNTCEYCDHWCNFPSAGMYFPEGVDARTCALEPCDITHMKNNECANFYCMSGEIYFGKDFGCINFQRKEEVVEMGAIPVCRHCKTYPTIKQYEGGLFIFCPNDECKPRPTVFEPNQQTAIDRWTLVYGNIQK